MFNTDFVYNIEKLWREHQYLALPYWWFDARVSVSLIYQADRLSKKMDKMGCVSKEYKNLEAYPFLAIIISKKKRATT